jgi:hypothetical protein
MDSVVLLKIESLNAGGVQQSGLIIQQAGVEIPTGPIVAVLDDSAAIPANTALLNVTSGAIRLRWAVIATFPFTANAFAQGAIAPKNSAPVRVTLDESGQLLDDASGFAVNGTGQIGPGSVLSAAKIPAHQNLVTFVVGDSFNLGRAVLAGATLQCTFVPDFSIVQVKLPKSLGGGTQSLNLTGGFLLVPVLTLAQPDRTKRGRR